MKYFKTLIAALLAAVGIGVASSYAIADVRVSEEMEGVVLNPLQQDSTRIVASWKSQCDLKGCPDSYVVLWSSGSTTKNRTTTATADTAWFYRPPIGDSALVTVSVTAIRRKLTSPTKTATFWLKNADVAPMPVDSLRIDTLKLDIVATKGVPGALVAAWWQDTTQPTPYDTTKLWVASDLDSAARHHKRLTGRDTVIAVNVGDPGYVAQLCAVYYNEYRREIYPMPRQMGGNAPANYVAACASGGWIVQLYARYKPGYTLRELPAVRDARREVDDVYRRGLLQATDATTRDAILAALEQRAAMRQHVRRAQERFATAVM